MEIAKILSHLGAWEKLNNEYSSEADEIRKALKDIDLVNMPRKKEIRGNQYFYSSSHFIQELTLGFRNLGWSVEDPEINKLRFSKERRSEIDAIRGTVGIDLAFGKFTFLESAIFVKIPLFIRAGRFKFAILITPIKSFSQQLGLGVCTFELVRDRLKALSPLPLHYPFVIIGISPDNLGLPQVEELTNKIDQYLIENIGLSMIEMQLMAERPNYDFKENLPDNNKLAKEICAFANHENGGYILVGIDDTGYPRGIPIGEIDDKQLRVQQVANDNCEPSPILECIPFEVPDKPDKRIIVIRVDENERKPCVVDGRVYIRAGTSARPANSDEIRRLALSSGVL
jgi:hypothetical protein